MATTKPLAVRGVLLFEWGVATDVGCDTCIGAPGARAVEAQVEMFGLFDAIAVAVWAGALGMKPVTVGVEMGFDKIWIDYCVAFGCQYGGSMVPGVSLELQ